MSNVVLLEIPITRWQCPLCDQQAVTQNPLPHTEMHNCRSLSGYWTPMVRVSGIELSRKDGILRPVDREDFIGDEIVRTDNNGKPIMAIDTVRPEGDFDRHVYAPTAIDRMETR